MRSDSLLSAMLFVLSAGFPASAETKLYVQSLIPTADGHIVNPQNLVGPPDGQFGGSLTTSSYDSLHRDYYQAVFDLGQTVTTDRLEVVYKGLGSIRFRVAMSFGELQLKQGYWAGFTGIDPEYAQAPGTVRTAVTTDRSGLQRFRYVAVYLIDSGPPNAGAGVWIDSVAALPSVPLDPPGPALTGTFTTFDYPGAVSTAPTGIDSFGQILGVALMQTGSARTASSFLWSRGVFLDLPRYGTADYTLFQGLNNNDMLVGNSEQGAFLYRYGSRSYSTISYPGSPVTWANGVNSLGEIAGSYESIWGWYEHYGYILFGDTFKTLRHPGTTQTDAYGIAGAYNGSPTRVVGCYTPFVAVAEEDLSVCRGYLWSMSGFFPIDFPDAVSTSPYAITAEATDLSIRIVGAYTDRLGKTHGFLLQNGPFGTYRSIDVPGATSTAARGINAFGHVVGTYTDASGTHGFRLVPGAA